MDACVSGVMDSGSKYKTREPRLNSSWGHDIHFHANARGNDMNRSPPQLWVK